MKRSRSRVVGALLGAVVVAASAGCAATDHAAGTPFPDVDHAALGSVRTRIVNVVHREYDHPQPGEHYAEGVTEPWCADFVSSVMREAGVPLTNPNSGSWRIPGVATLTEYYQSTGRFHGPDYRPRPGDVVLYAPPNRFKQHTGIVVEVDGDHVTTVGGNEPPTSISVNSFDRSTVRGIVGYGTPA
ncbi:MAG: CHAP domain-containing protein [Gordonia sp. (in: high G+C Gram-positive bacteria)]|uniref:CHAP domain-containing protein n=1 Tax=Gordonia sp. (in: high G+C Gram-positive bacteria) TaxID=84139 RepID=UPI0039E4DF42